MRVADLRVLVPLLERVRIGEKPTFRMRSAAQFLLHRLGRPSKKGKKAAAQRKETKAAGRRDATTIIREAVFQRARGRCELNNDGLPTELHHLEGGSGRTALQAVSNCVAACGPCHRAFHAHPEGFRLRVLELCELYSYPIPRRFKGEPRLSTQGSEDRIPPNATPVLGGKGESNG